MSRKTRTGKTITDEDLVDIATDFENREFTPQELTKIRKTRRRSPRLGDAKAEVYTFRAPPNYKSRIRQRAKSDHTTESQVIRDALDAYL